MKWRAKLSIILISLIIHLFMLKKVGEFSFEQASTATNLIEKIEIPILEKLDSLQAAAASAPIILYQDPLPMVTAQSHAVAEGLPQEKQKTPEETAEQAPVEKEKPSEIESAEPPPKIQKNRTNTAMQQTKLPAKRMHRKSQPKKQLTLADLTRDFLERQQNNAQNEIHMMNIQSHAQGKANPHQLAYERFLHKILAALVNAYKINKYNAPRSAQVQEMAIQLVLNLDGSVNNLQLLQSSGIHEIDSFALSLFRDACFPSLPQFLQAKVYPVPVFCISSIAQFQSIAYWTLHQNQ